MSRIRSKGNHTTELRFVRLLRRYRIRGWRRGCNLFGKPDFVFRRAKIAVFIDGDFWHGNPKTYRVPKTNSEYWRTKITSNRRRDRLVNRHLRRSGWTVVRFWESNLRDEQTVVAKLRLLVGATEPKVSSGNRRRA
jgi:DNA mismatch endonuclease (patch repair protein)